MLRLPTKRSLQKISRKGYLFLFCCAGEAIVLAHENENNLGQHKNYGKISDFLSVEMLKTYEFFPTFFPQAKKSLPRDFCLGDYFRSFSIFQEVTTLGIFDVVPICGELFSYYHVHKLVCQGYSAKTANCYLQKLKKYLLNQTTQEFVVFVLTDIKVGKEVSLDCQASPWHFELKIANLNLTPKYIEPIRNDKSLESILYHRFDRMKKIYKLVFTIPTEHLTSMHPPVNCKFEVKYMDLRGKTLLPCLDFLQKS